ncbi:MAG: leucine-rich repeat domain-containing protein [Gammaproteobacteria bacterium]|jgi:internalin A
MSQHFQHNAKDRQSQPLFLGTWIVVVVLLITACTGGGGDGGSPPVRKSATPQTPANLNAIAGNQQVTLTWGTVPDASGYTLYWNNTPDVAKDSSHVVRNVSPGYRHQELTNGQVYFYRIAAANGSGESLPSDEITAMPGGHTLADTVTDANLRHCLTNYSTSTPVYADTISGEVDCSYRGINDLEGLQFLAALTALNLAGNNIQNISALSQLSSLTTLDLSGNQLNRDAEAVLEALFQFGALTQLSIAGNPQLSCAFIDAMLDTISATDISASEAGVNCAVYSQTPAPIGTLTPVAAKAIGGNEKVTVTWEEVTGASHYNIYWGTASGITTESENVIAGAHPPYVHSGLSNGATYYYVVTAVSGGAEGRLSPEVWATPSSEGTAIDGVFTDTNLQSCVSDYAVGKGWTFTHEITGYLDCSSRAISDLQGIGQLPELSQLNVMNNAIADTTPLATLTNLTRLYISNNQIDSLVGLADLSSLNFLNLGRNRITTVNALAGLDNLTALYLNSNQIVDAGALAGLINLQILDLRENSIGGEDIGNIDELASLVNASSILLAGNYDIACTELAALFTALGPNIVDIAANVASIDCIGVPNPPLNVSAAGGNQRVILTWDNIINASAYNIYWSNSPAVSISSANKKANVRSGYQHTALTNGLAYYYVVTAENASGESEISQEVSAVPQQVVIAGLFADSNLQTCIEELASMNGWTTAEQVSGVVNCSARAISDVSGIEHLTGVTALSLNENNLTDITAIGYLDKLRSLSLYRNNITSVDALVNMTALRDLFISNNLISKVHPVGSLPQLQVVDLRNNRIGSSGSGGVDQLTSLTNATLISVSGNPSISCIELQNLLDTLGASVIDMNSAIAGENCTRPSLIPAGIQAVGGNSQISLRWVEVPVATAYNIYWATVSGVTPASGQKVTVTSPQYAHTGLDNDTTYYYVITSQLASGQSAPSEELAARPSANGVPLAGLFPDRALAKCVNALANSNGWSYALEVNGILNCSAQQITDLSGLEQLSNLSVLRLGSNNIEDISSVASLGNLTFLDLYNNAISDVSVLSGLNTLRTLYLHNNNISDISALAGLNNLDYLILDENAISDPTPITGINTLTRLFFRANLLTDVNAFDQLTQLTELYLNNNSITDVSALAGMVYLQQLDLRNNHIGGQGVGNVDTLSSLTNVSKIRLSGNNLISCTELTSLIAVLGPNATDLGEAQLGVNCQAP